jgi:hypothetical protein
MKKEIVYTEKYALILSDDEIKQGDYRVNIQRNTIHFVDEESSYFNQRNDVFKKVIAHLPLFDAPILEGLPLLEKLPQVMEKKQAEITEKIFNYDNPNAKFGIEPNEVLNLNNMEKKQTAVDYLVQELIKQGFFKRLPVIAIQQAAQMEREQIEMACNQQEFEDIDGLGICETISKGQQYYNETYG